MTREQKLAEAVVFLLRKYVSETSTHEGWDYSKDKLARELEEEYDLIEEEENLDTPL